MEKRIQVLQRELTKSGFAGAIINCSRDLFYYSGTTIPSWLAVSPSDYRLFVRGEIALARRQAVLGKERIVSSRKPQDISAFFPAGAAVIGTELDVMTVTQLSHFQKYFPGVEFADISPVILAQRKVKEPGEIPLLRDACAVVHLGHERVLETLREGMTELDLAAEVEDAHRRGGHEGIFFIRLPDFYMSRGPISSGTNLFENTGVVYTITGVGLTPSMPAGPSRRRISRGDVIVIDIPVLVNGYHADQSRTYVLGRAAPEILSMYDDLKTIADYLICEIRPGMTSADVCRMAFGMAARLGREGQFQSFGPGQRSRLIGHGIGVELNEPPVIMENDLSRIEEGYVIALDIHMLDRAIGAVKLEDMVLVGRAGNEILNISPRSLFEIT
jgi:Xaa-Pro aminopeptidase